MVHLPANPTTLTEYAESCRDFLNTRRSVGVLLVTELSAACSGLETLAAELDRHSLRLSHGNCSPAILTNIFVPRVLEKMPTIKDKVRRAMTTANGGNSNPANEAAGAVKECYDRLKEKVKEYKVALAAAMEKRPDHRWGYDGKARFLPRRDTAGDLLSEANLMGRLNE